MPASASFELAELGWDDGWAATMAAAVQLLGVQFVGSDDALPARVARLDVGACTVLGPGGVRRAAVPHDITVAVGDWVVLHSDPPVVAGALPRRTAIVRRAAGLDPRAQTLATNVDTVLVLVAADGRVSPRGVERYITVVWESGATPVVVLTKADLVSSDELDDAVERLEPACVGIALLVVSAQAGTGLDALAPYFRRGRTVALLGSSGAGKSTLANHLAGTDLATGAVRTTDGRGRHTTTHRELVPLPAGGLLLDTPGLREVGLWQADEGVARTFPEITALVDQCRFTDCSHRQEPGCALLAAVADGRITEERLASWHKLRRELDRVAARDDPQLREHLRSDQRRLFRSYAQARKQSRKPR